MAIVEGLDEGWLYIFKNDHSQYMKLLINGGIQFDEKADPTIESLPMNYRYGYNLQYYERPLSASDIYFLSYEDFEKFKMSISSWNSQKLYITVVNKTDLVTGTTTTYDETNDKIVDTAKNFLSLGVREGDILEITSGNDADKEFMIYQIQTTTNPNDTLEVFGDLTDTASETRTYKIHRGTMIDSFKRDLVEGTSTSIDGTNDYLYDTTQTFVTDGVTAGQYLEILEGDNQGTYIIKTVAETYVEVQGDLEDETDETRLYEIYDAPKRYITCFLKDAKGNKKEFGGEGDIWNIDKLSFDQS